MHTSWILRRYNITNENRPATTLYSSLRKNSSLENAIALCPNCHRQRHFG
ncbi:HNH endonuclease [Bordetella sp. BOR01]|nr:HNH endonuclease [Bordetella sp. BOR01]